MGLQISGHGDPRPPRDPLAAANLAAPAGSARLGLRPGDASGLAGKGGAPVVTGIVEAGPFTAAEDYHKDYLEKNPGGYTCHFMRD